MTEREKKGGVYVRGWSMRLNRAFTLEDGAQEGRKRTRGWLGLQVEDGVCMGGESAGRKVACVWDDGDL